MNWRSFEAFLLWVSFREFPLVCGQESHADTAVLDPSLSDVKFTTNVLFERNGVSKPRCASLCMRTDQCATFTCTQTVGRLCQCRGYQKRKTTSDPHEDSPGTKAYVFHVKDTHAQTTPADTPPATEETTTEEAITAKADWSDTSCSTNAECTEPNSSCFDDKCMCIHGYYYSVGAKVCQEDCPPADLQNTYLLYEDAGLMGYNDATYYFWTLEACKLQCDGDGACLHYEYTDGETCYTSHTSSRQLTLADTDYVSHYQRNCA